MATVAGLDITLQLLDTTPGNYEIVLHQCHYVNYKES